MKAEFDLLCTYDVNFFQFQLNFTWFQICSTVYGCSKFSIDKNAIFIHLEVGLQQQLTSKDEWNWEEKLLCYHKAFE